MAPLCVVHLCRNIGTHRFPKNDVRLSQWIEAIRIKPGLLRKNSLICAAHFLPNDFALTPTFWTKLDRAPKILKKTAVPSVFPWNQASRGQEQVAQEQDQGSSSQSLTFDTTKIHSTYSRTPKITFVEELPFVDVATSNLIEDPLELSDEDQLQFRVEDSEQSSNRESDFHINELNPNDSNIVEIEIDTVHDNSAEFPLGGQPHVTVQQRDKEIQTEENSMLSFSIYNHQSEDKFLHFYTGLENFKKIMLVFHSLGESKNNLKYFYGNPPAKIDVLEQFFITLILLRRHKPYQEIAMLYNITLKHVYTIFITWIRFMSLQWKNLDLWVDKECIKAYMPFHFLDEYPATRTLLDATECPIKKPKLPCAQQVTFSSYKNKNTIKFVIGITPSGLISYVSPSYGGSATDRQIIERSNILRKFDCNDEIMVDKGLNVQDIFLPYGVKVNMPAFFKKGNQICCETLKSNRKVASKRVHVERVIGMLKTYKILTEPMNQTETLLSSDIVFICAMLVNFRSNIMNKNA